MGKKANLNKLAVYIGLYAAHRVLIRLANENESVPHLEREVDNYERLSIRSSKGNWNKDDLGLIKEIAVKRCCEKLEHYQKVDDANYRLIEETVDEIMKGLELI